MQRRKGVRRERELAGLLGGRRQPHSGALRSVLGESLGGDVVLPGGLRVECKSRRDGFRLLYGWLAGVDLLAVRADRRGWLLVLPLEKAREVLAALTEAHTDGEREQAA